LLIFFKLFFFFFFFENRKTNGRRISDYNNGIGDGMSPIAKVGLDDEVIYYWVPRGLG
jgi:hypothetical protein